MILRLGSPSRDPQPVQQQARISIQKMMTREKTKNLFLPEAQLHYFLF